MHTTTSYQELLHKGKVNVCLFGMLDGVTMLDRHKELFGSERARGRIIVFKYLSGARK
jgi:hypothetical protein